MMEKYLNFVFKYPLLILAALAGLTYYLFVSIAGLSEDNNPYFLPESHPARSAIYEMRGEFTGTYDSILVAFYNKEGVFNTQTLNAVYELTEKSKSVMFVDETDVEWLQYILEANKDVKPFSEGVNQILEGGLTQSDGELARQLYIDSADWGVAYQDRKFLKTVAERLDPVREMAGMAATENVFLDDAGTLFAQKTVNNYNQDPQLVKDAIMNNELMEHGFVNEEGTIALLVVELSLLEDDAYGQVRAYEAYKAMVAEYQAAHPEFKDEMYVGGVPVFFAAQKQVIDHDFALLLPIVLLLIAVVLALFFRTVLGVVLPLLNVILCTIWTLGFMALANFPMDIITAILPVFLITICSSDAIHVMAEYYHQKKVTKERAVAMRRALVLMASPVILTTLTTCFTFMISTSTAIESLRNFGILISVGMFAALIISLLLIPAVIALFKGKVVANPTQVTVDDKKIAQKYWISRVLIGGLKPVMKNRSRFTLVFAMFMIGAAYTASHVEVDDMGSGYFAQDSMFRIADDFINENIAGTSPGWIEIDTGDANSAMSYDALMFVDKLETFIHEQEKVSFSYSAARYVRRIYYTLNDFEPSYDRLPEKVEILEYTDEDGKVVRDSVSGEDLIRQSILMYENSGGTDINNVYSNDFSKTMILYTLGTTVASDYQNFLDALEPWLKENTPEGYSVKLAGTPIIWTAVLDALITSQTLSVFLAFATVVAVMSLWLRSIKLGLAGTLPLISTVVVYFALMAIFGIELNIGTAIISFLVLGIVDYSVHYLLRIKVELERGVSIDEALESAILVSGRAIMANVFVFSIGFVALLFSEFKPLVDLGTLVGLSLFISGVMTLFIVTLFAPWFFSGKAVEAIKGEPMNLERA